MTCVHCGGDTEARKTVMQNGAIAIGIYCLSCNRRATPQAWVSKSRFTAAEIEVMPVEANYTDAICCQYAGCNSKAIEWNHYAPRYLFGDDCEHWIIGPLCTVHHRVWHAGLKGELMRHCPKCRQTLNASAIVEAFNEPPNWSFWGAQGSRFKRCAGTTKDGRGYVHFIVRENGREYHRLAYGMPVGETS